MMARYLLSLDARLVLFMEERAEKELLAVLLVQDKQTVVHEPGAFLQDLTRWNRFLLVRSVKRLHLRQSYVILQLSARRRAVLRTDQQLAGQTAPQQVRRAIFEEIHARRRGDLSAGVETRC